MPPPEDAFGAEQYLVSHTFWLANHALYGDHTHDETFAGFDRLVALSPERVATASICGFAGATAAFCGRWDEVERFQRIALGADPNLQFAFWGGQLLMYGGMVKAWKGDVDGALASFAEGRARYTGIGGRSGLPTFTASVALLVAEHGRLADARLLVASARDVLETHGERWNEPVVLIAEAVVACHASDSAVATKRLAEAVAVADRQGAHALADRARRIATDLGIVILR